MFSKTAMKLHLLVRCMEVDGRGRSYACRSPDSMEGIITGFDQYLDILRARSMICSMA